ncbi:MAG: oxygen-independent coproporphyrinogen III oxidase [Flavobacteriales bacterium]|jgi:oxygen-independent coproporphyrinogen-3 oxidase|nr:oxygen-independent coproporphyrinogen III oxidase [Flavobacteriales bacterium]
MAEDLIKKYNVQGPRYTSYPTVPFWDMDHFSREGWKDRLKKTFELTNSDEGISLYIHMPFCESLCTFCGCHKRITKNHSVEDKYIKYLLKEWQMYLDFLPEKPVIQEFHFGGGTPTFFAPKNLKKLVSKIIETATVPTNAKWSLEGHPNNTTLEHLQVLADFGFSRISFGIQDYDPIVQKAINRIQPLENVVRVTEESRKLGFKSICHDLVYGLPFQKMSSIILTIENTLNLRPDRIALYSYAHVPWIKGNGQRGFKEEDIPRDNEKRALYEYAKEQLLAAGYLEIGIDHFSLPHDELYKAVVNGKMHRNFMGYSDSKTDVMIGLGVSSISDSWTAFAQNEKKIDKYYQLIDEGKIPVVKGHLLTENDLAIRKHILNLMCFLETEKTDGHLIDWKQVETDLEEMEKDGLVCFEKNKITITQKGSPFIRNVAMTMDEYLHKMNPEVKIFSQTI